MDHSRIDDIWREQQQNEETPPPYSARQSTLDNGNYRANFVGGGYLSNNNTVASPISSSASPSRSRLPPLPLWPVCPPPLCIRAVNNLHAYHENGSVRQQFVIDPYLQSGNDDSNGDHERRNLKLILQSGDIVADVWILGDGARRSVVKTSIEIRNENGPVTLRIVCLKLLA